MSGMIEKLADVAREAFHSDPERGLSETYEAMVRAVLAVLREPNEQMLTAGFTAGRFCVTGGTIYSEYSADPPELDTDAPDEIFTAMIDAILTEG